MKSVQTFKDLERDDIIYGFKSNECKIRSYTVLKVLQFPSSKGIDYRILIKGLCDGDREQRYINLSPHDIDDPYIISPEDLTYRTFFSPNEIILQSLATVEARKLLVIYQHERSKLQRMININSRLDLLEFNSL